jgi:hypothetical protein
LRIADNARLPIEAFMELFPGPQACYLEALDVLGDEMLQLVADPGLVSAEWADAVCRTIARLLAYLASSPARLRTLAVKALEAGPPAIANVAALAYEVATLLTEGAPQRPRSRVAVEGIAGALGQILTCEVLAGRGHRLPVLSEYVSYVALAPFLGPEASVEAIVRSRAAEAPASPEAPCPGEARPVRSANGAHAANGARASSGTPAANGTHASSGTPSANNTHAANGTPSPSGAHAANGTPSASRAHAVNGNRAAGGAPAVNETHTGNGTNGSAPTEEDYRRLAERRSAKCVNTTPTSTESTITTIKGA